MEKYFMFFSFINTMVETQEKFLEDRCKIEAILFNSSRPVEKSLLKKAINNQNEDYLSELLDNLQSIYSGNNSAIEIVQYADSAAMIPKKIFLPDYLSTSMQTENLLDDKEKVLLSFIAFFQPIDTREINKTFGKNIKRQLNILKQKGFITDHDSIFTTTALFAKYFNVPNDVEEIQKRFSNAK